MTGANGRFAGLTPPALEGPSQSSPHQFVEPKIPESHDILLNRITSIGRC